MMRFVMVLAAVAILAGCNTLEGLGKDMKEGGAAVEKTVKERKQ